MAGGYFRAFSFHTELLQIFKYENLLTSLILFSFTNAKYPAYSKLSTYQKGYYGCGYCCLVSGVFLYWLPIGLKILIVSLGEKHTQKKTFSFPTDFFSACVRIKWNYVRESTLYTVPYQCKMLRCVVISLITYLFRMEFPMHCCS